MAQARARRGGPRPVSAAGDGAGSNAALAPVDEGTASPRGGTGRGRRFRASSGASGGFRAARTIRTRILVSYVVLVALAGILSSFAIHQVLDIRLEDRLQEALSQEVLEINRLIIDGRDPQTGQPFTSVDSLFDVFFARNVPSAEEALLAFTNGQLYRSAMMRFPLDGIPPPILERFSTSTAEAEAGRSTVGQVDTPLGPAYYRALPVHIGADSGSFVVLILPASDLAEINRLQFWGTVAVVAVLVLASAFAWVVVGRVLVPVRLLTDTARLISQSDLRRRIPVQGSDEAAEMAHTFNAMLDRLEAVFRSEREFIRDAGHELRVPLTICLGNLALLEEGVLDDNAEERSKTLAVTADELERMGRIVEDLQILADSEHPEFLQQEAFDLESFTHELAAKARALSPREWQVDMVGEGVVVADRHRLTEALLNLAHNALQHTTPQDTLAVGTAVDGDEVRIWVRDTGAGVPVAEQTRIFGRLRRGSTAYRRYRGSGLGLAIVKKIAEVHGGGVELNSELGAGATFTIVIPRYPRRGWGGAEDSDR